MSTTTAYERLIDALRDHGRTVNDNGHGRAQAQCPAHDDGRASLSVTTIEGSALVYCHAGCDIADVLPAVGLTLADLFDEKRGATYEYPDGRRVHRSPRKEFRQSGNTKGQALFRGDRINGAATVFVCEGEKCVLAIESAGGAAVSPAMGAGKAHKFDWSPLQGKTAVVVADRDEPGRKHAVQVAKLLAGIAATVQIVEAAVGKDAADHVAAGRGLDELVAVDDATVAEPAKAPKPERPLYPPPTAPLEVARKLYARHRVGGNGLRMLLAWRGGWKRWGTTHWAELDTPHLRSEIYEVLGEVDYEHPVKECGVIIWEARRWNPDKRKVANVVEAMAAVGHLPSDIDTPSWIDLHSAAKTPAAQMVSCANGLLDLSTRTVHDHTPALFNTVAVPFDYQPDAPSPTAWLEFLASVWPDDAASVMLLQEFVGYVLSGRTDMQKLLLLIGPTRSGKGTIARLLAQLVGTGNVAGPTLASLGTNFGLSPLLGRPLAIISDARLGDTPAHTVVERLLSITGEDLLTVDRKFREPYSGKLPTRFAILSNELPRFKDSSGAIANRMLILQMTNSFLGREDRTLDDRLRAELPGILLWALEGLDRLNNDGRFTVPQSSRDAADLMADMASPVSAFVRDCCRRSPDATVAADGLYEAWKAWCEDNGHHAGAKSTFGRNLRAVVPEIRVTQPRGDGARIRSYVCIALLTVPPVPPGETAGQPSDAGMGLGQGIPCHSKTDDEPQLPGTGHPVPNGAAKPQVNHGGTGGTGATPFKAVRETGFAPPTGPGRCGQCGFHIGTQGHREDCRPTQEAG